jgi:probable FeS assembly SUF system protein SufT
MHAEIEVKREVKAVMIPEGNEVTLPEGTTGWLTQALGGTYTIQLPTGRKYRIAGSDGDAIGQEIVDVAANRGVEPATVDQAEKQAWQLLKHVHDPEIPVNVVDLGLVYEMKMHKRGDGMLLAVLRMSLTAPGCGMGDVLLDDARRVLKTIPGVDSVDAKIVFDPIWNPSMMSEAAKLQLGMY